MIHRFNIHTSSQGLYEITSNVAKIVHSSKTDEGLCTLFVQHTSASLLIQENADPSAKHDLEQWFNRLVKEDDSLYTHTLEGPDDMPAHIKATLIGASLAIPISDSRLALGTWQGIYLWEHRQRGGQRNIIAHISI